MVSLVEKPTGPPYQGVSTATAPSSLVAKAHEGSCVAIDVFSATRNSFNAAAACQQGTAFAAGLAPVVGGMSIMGGALGTFVGGDIARNAIIGIHRNVRTGNREGAGVEALWGLAGIEYGVASGSMVVGSAATFAHAASVAAVATNAVLIPVGFALYGTLAIYAAYGIVANGRFRFQLEQKERESPAAVLSWLKEQVEGDQKKRDQFVFRTSQAACRFVCKEVTATLISDVIQGSPEAKDKADKILQAVKRENARQLFKYIFLAVIAILGILAFAFTVVFAGPLAPILFAITGLLWLGVDSSALHGKLADFFCGPSLIPK